MKQPKLKLTVFIFCIAVAILAFPPQANADTWNKKTTVTFNAPVEIPGVGAQVLPAGTYGIQDYGFAGEPQHRPDFQRAGRPHLRNHPRGPELPIEACGHFPGDPLEQLLQSASAGNAAD